MIFDSHAHLICADQKAYPPNPLRGELSPGEFDDPMTVEKLVALMDSQGVTQACAVQRAHVYGYDNSYILDSVDRFPDRFRAVVVLNPLDPATPAHLRALREQRGIAGVRFGAASFPESPLDWLKADEARQSWRAAADLGLPICIHVLHVQREAVLPALRKQAAAMTSATIVVDHVGGAHAAVVEQRWLESQGRSPGPEYVEDALRLADHANVVMKFSDINLEASPDPAAFVTRIAGHFGAERVIWGSDIGQSRGNYQHMVQLAQDAVAGLAPAARQAMLHGNASRIYGGAASR
jgi:L-fuconolactonase